MAEKQAKTCRKCGRKYVAWRCPKCYRRKHSGGGSGNSFLKRGGAASVLYSAEFAPLSVYPEAAPSTSGSENVNVPA